MSLTPDQVFLPLALQLRDCLATKVLLLGDDAPAKVGVRIGSVGGPVLGPNEDECCEGLAWVRVASAQPIGQDPPAPQTELRSCGPYAWLVQYELGIARCVPWGSDVDPAGLDPLTEEQWLTAFVRQADDFAVLRASVECCFASSVHYMINQWQPSDIQGGCTATTLTVTVQTNAPCGDC